MDWKMQALHNLGWEASLVLFGWNFEKPPAKDKIVCWGYARNPADLALLKL
ncbi:hypothetical protein SAY87_001575 [Trapa incisa]|uniref:Uncharacterized protein n=1 Tax=Trapa incisa TaxID=236973 RepID=A0AAN7JH45_9MYRT|nr:hypothetical protein SAY87_001575 [Trapa incisa]